MVHILIFILLLAVMVGGMGWHYAEVISMGGEDSFTTLMKVSEVQYLPPGASPLE